MGNASISQKLSEAWRLTSLIKALNNISFLKKLNKHLLVGISGLILLYFFQTIQPVAILAQQAGCPAIGITTIIEPANGTALSAGTQNVTLRWVAASGAEYYEVFLKKANGEGVYGPININGTQTSVSGKLANEVSYSWYVFPRTNCGGGGNGQVVVGQFSVAQAQPVICSSQPIFCPDGGGEDGNGGSYVYPNPNNNCQAVCPGQSAGTLSCSITTQILNPLNNGYNYQLTGNPSGYSQYQWDLTNDGSFDKSGQIINQNFFGNTTVRLQISNGSGFGTCYTNINLPAAGNPSGSCSIYSRTESRCLNQQMCNFNVIYNTNYCGSRSENGSFGCFNSSQCGFNPAPPPPPVPQQPSISPPAPVFQPAPINISNNNNNINSNTNTIRVD